MRPSLCFEARWIRPSQNLVMGETDSSCSPLQTDFTLETMKRQLMKHLAILLFSLFQPLSAADTLMNHRDALTNYVQKLNTHSWSEIDPCVTQDAVFVFTENTFVGKEAAKAAFEKTFATIQEEVFTLHDISWTAVTESMASCHYEYRWKGRIDGQNASGGGRGTSILVKVEGHWLITHEHLGPYPR